MQEHPQRLLLLLVSSSWPCRQGFLLTGGGMARFLHTRALERTLRGRIIFKPRRAL